ncbi:MAG: hypothetical protein EA397_16830 [Deltaproteobacteria bacterium]|nr:MAG: hypothetical protein EA397_16830 [Deltaproteobacteria bacterium]
MGEGLEVGPSRPRSEGTWVIGLVIAVVGAMLIWLAVAPATYDLFGWDRSAMTLTDLLAPISTVMAAVAVTYTGRALFYQASELSLQRAELQLQREELRRSTEALQKQSSELTSQTASLQAQVEHGKRTLAYQHSPILGVHQSYIVIHTHRREVTLPSLINASPHTALSCYAARVIFWRDRKMRTKTITQQTTSRFLLPEKETIAFPAVEGPDIQALLGALAAEHPIYIVDGAVWKNVMGGAFHGVWVSRIDYPPIAYGSIKDRQLSLQEIANLDSDDTSMKPVIFKFKHHTLNELCRVETGDPDWTDPNPNDVLPRIEADHAYRVLRRVAAAALTEAHKIGEADR